MAAAAAAEAAADAAAAPPSADVHRSPSAVHVNFEFSLRPRGDREVSSAGWGEGVWLVVCWCGVAGVARAARRRVSPSPPASAPVSALHRSCPVRRSCPPLLPGCPLLQFSAQHHVTPRPPPSGSSPCPPSPLAQLRSRWCRAPAHSASCCRRAMRRLRRQRTAGCRRLPAPTPTRTKTALKWSARSRTTPKRASSMPRPGTTRRPARATAAQRRTRAAAATTPSRPAPSATPMPTSALWCDMRINLSP